MSAISKEKREFKITDLQNGQSVTVVLNTRTNLRRLTEQSIDKLIGKNQNAGAAKGSQLKKNTGKINLTDLLDQSPKMEISELKSGETIVIASAAPLKAARIVGITVAAGIDLLTSRLGKPPGGKTRERYNLDVF